MPEFEPKTPEYYVETFSFKKDFRTNNNINEILKPEASGISYIVDLDNRKIHLSDLSHARFRETVQAHYTFEGTVWTPKNSKSSNSTELSIHSYDQSSLIRLFNESYPQFKNDVTKVVELMEKKILNYIYELSKNSLK